jgi:hypothetical protein
LHRSAAFVDRDDDLLLVEIRAEEDLQHERVRKRYGCSCLNPAASARLPAAVMR